MRQGGTRRGWNPATKIPIDDMGRNHSHLFESPNHADHAAEIRRLTESFESDAICCALYERIF